VLLLAACGAGSGARGGAVPLPNAPRLLPALPLAEVFVLESSGIQPEDTAVAVPAGDRRVVVLRRSGPDYGLFVRLEFPARSLGSNGQGGPVQVTVRPRPGQYGLDLGVSGTLAEGATIAFSYGAHFVAPAGARARYGSDLAFEKELAIGRLSEDGRLVFLPTVRPGTDMVSAPLAGPGRYLVAAPR
jgi:hypothetical protein